MNAEPVFSVRSLVQSQRRYARAQFGSGIVFDPTQSAHAVQQILQAKQLYTTTVQTEQKCDRRLQSCAADGQSSRRLSTHRTPISAVSSGRCSPSLQIRMAIRLPWINAASTGYGRRSRKSGGQPSAYWADHRLRLSERSRAASHCGTRRDGRSLRLGQRQQPADGRHDPSELRPNERRTSASSKRPHIPPILLSTPRWRHCSASIRRC